MTIVNNTCIGYLKVAKKVDLSAVTTHIKELYVCEVIDMLTDLTEVIILYVVISYYIDTAYT